MLPQGSKRVPVDQPSRQASTDSRHQTPAGASHQSLYHDPRYPPSIEHPPPRSRNHQMDPRRGHHTEQEKKGAMDPHMLHPGLGRQGGLSSQSLNPIHTDKLIDDLYGDQLDSSKEGLRHGSQASHMNPSRTDALIDEVFGTPQHLSKHPVKPHRHHPTGISSKHAIPQSFSQTANTSPDHDHLSTRPGWLPAATPLSTTGPHHTSHTPRMPGGFSAHSHDPRSSTEQMNELHLGHDEDSDSPNASTTQKNLQKKKVYRKMSAKKPTIRRVPQMQNQNPDEEEVQERNLWTPIPGHREEMKESIIRSMKECTPITREEEEGEIAQPNSSPLFKPANLKSYE